MATTEHDDLVQRLVAIDDDEQLEGTLRAALRPRPLLLIAAYSSLEADDRAAIRLLTAARKRIDRCASIKKAQPTLAKKSTTSSAVLRPRTLSPKTTLAKRVTSALESLQHVIDRLLDGGGSTSQKAAPERNAPPPELSEVRAQHKNLADGMGKVRSLLQRAGVGLAAAATAVVGGLGYTQLHQIFPLPGGTSSKTLALVIASIFAASAGSTWLAARFLRAQRQILIVSDTHRWQKLGLGRRDRKVGKRFARDEAQEEEAPNLLGVELRALRLARIARQKAASATDEAAKAEAKAISEESSRLSDKVELALHRTASVILEDRSRRAFSLATLIPLALAVAGIAGTFAMSDYLKGQRELPAKRAACVKAENDAGLSGTCTAFESASAAKVRAAAAKAKETNAAAKRKKLKESLPAAQQSLLNLAAACTTLLHAQPNSAKRSPDETSQLTRLCLQAK